MKNMVASFEIGGETVKKFFSKRRFAQYMRGCGWDEGRISETWAALKSSKGLLIDTGLGLVKSPK